MPFDMSEDQVMEVLPSGRYAFIIYAREGDQVRVPSRDEVIGEDDIVPVEWFDSYFSGVPKEGYVPRRPVKCQDLEGLTAIAGWATRTHVFVCNTRRVGNAQAGAKALAQEYERQQSTSTSQ
mgnify:CR=1 FL=1